MADHGWTERFTMDGVPYYHNQKTEAVTWDKPDALKSQTELQSESGKWRWVRDEELAWAPAREESTDEKGNITCVKDDGEEVIMKPTDPDWPLLKSSLIHLEEDLVLIDNMNEGLILHNLRERFANNQIYTAIGTILISVNPFQRLPLYSPSIMDKYYHSGGNKRLPPHIFGIADSAYKAMLYDKADQSILISGESGAGKTEATKQCLAFFAEVAGSENNVEQKIIQANPILEAFGNAKTTRNNNSSRFGKYMEIHFDKKGKIIGARTENYLLEKSRVVYQSEEERNYHIFFQLCLGPLAKRYKLSSDLEEYKYLCGAHSVDTIDDKADFKEVCEAMDILGFEEEERDWLFSVTAAVLHLGNVEFEFNDAETAAVITNKRVVRIVAELLEVDEKVLADSLLSRTMVIRGQKPTKIPFKPEEALAAAASLAKSVYGKVFDWLVQRVNKSVAFDKGSERYIGVLDIFGFEIFENNSFEQLCINFANEKLQQHFNNYTFKLEEKCYQTEKINFTHIDFIDNQPILDLIEKKPKGLLVLLDEECVFPKGTDATWSQKVKQTHGKSDYFKRYLKKDTAFYINHYAGQVMYDADGFLTKNKDTVWDDIWDMISASENKRTASLYPPRPKSSKKKISLGGQFRQQLNNLMTKLNKTAPHYVRCVKPNSSKSPSEFVSPMCLEQLRYAGVFEAIRIRQNGYPFRRKHDEFVRRYKCLALKDDGWLPLSNTQAKPLCKELLDLTKQDFSDVKMGRTMVLYRAPQQRVLELLRNLALERVCLTVQCWNRTILAQYLLKRMKIAAPVLQAALTTRTDLEKTRSALQFTADTIGSLSAVHPFEMKLVSDCKFLLSQLEERKRVTAVLAEVLPKDPEANFDALSHAVAEGDAIAEYPGTPEQMKIYTDTKAKLELTIARRETRKSLAEATKEADKEAINTFIAKAKELGIENASEVGKGREMLTRIAQEEKFLAELLAALNANNCLKWTPDAQSSVSAATLEAKLKAAEDFNMKTPEGRNAVAAAKEIIPLRKVLSSAPDWDGTSHWAKVDEVLNSLDPESTVEEVVWARDEIKLRTRRRELLTPLKEAYDALNEAQLKSLLATMKEPWEAGADQMERMQAFEAEISQLAAEAFEKLTKAKELLKTAITTNEEEALQEAIKYAIALPVNESKAAHLLDSLITAKLLLGLVFHMLAGFRSEVGLMLDDALASATSAQLQRQTTGSVVELKKEAVVSELRLQAANVKASIEFANSFNVTLSEKAQLTMSQAQAICQLRHSLLAQDWPQVEEAINLASQFQIETPDVSLARDEIAGRAAAEDVVEKLTNAVADMPTKYHDRIAHPSESIFETCLAQAERLQMKELDCITSGKDFLQKIKTARAALQEALVVTQYDDYITLAEGFNDLYPLIEGNCQLLNDSIACAEAFQYETKEVQEARHLLQELTIVHSLQYSLQQDGYYEGDSPSVEPASVIVVDGLVAAYEPAATFEATTELGTYVILKSYHTIQIRGSIQQFNQNWEMLHSAVEAAAQIGYDVPELVSARQLLAQCEVVRNAMQEAEDKVVQSLLEEAVTLFEALFYENENTQRVRALRDKVIELNEESRKSLWLMDKKRMQAVSDEAKAIRLVTPHFDKIDGYLSLGEESWLKMEIKKAKEIGDEPRKIRLAIRLKDCTLDQFGSMFSLEKMRTLRTPQDYAAAKLLTTDRKKLMLGFLKWTKHPIHTSLTVIEEKHDLSEAKKVFKNVLGFMCDKKYPYPTTLATEVITSAITFPNIRTEIYCQIIKQLTEHPVPVNKQKGWDLMAICCWQFPPNPDLENILEIYLRNAPQRSSKYIALLRDVTYGGMRSVAPSADEIDTFLKDFNDPMKPTGESKFDIEQELKTTEYPQEFFDDPEKLFLETEIELK